MPKTSRRYWLFKSEPSEFSLQDLAKAPDRTTCWDGVRNFQARNTLRDEIQVGDGVLFHHSSIDPPGIAGTAIVVRQGYPDHTAWDPKNPHFDPKSTPGNPIWYMVDIRLERIFDEPLGLPLLKKRPGLKSMMLLKKGSRLSIQPVTAREWHAVLALADR